MVQAIGGRRAQLKQEMLAEAEALWAGFDSYETITEDSTKNYIAKRVQCTDGVTAILSKYRADGFTEELLEQWRADPSSIGPQLNPKLTRTVLPEDEGHQVVLVQIKMPMMISNRSTVSCFYEHEREDGFKLKMNSSRGNEEIIAAQAAAIGKDVVANNVLYIANKTHLFAIRPDEAN